MFDKPVRVGTKKVRGPRPTLTQKVTQAMMQTASSSLR